MNFGDLLRGVATVGATALGSAIPGVGAIAGPALGAAANGLFSAAAVERERAWSEKMYNKYNSPAALVRQYQEAGINPALMFGQSAIPAPTTSTAASAPDNPFGDVVGMLGALMQLDMLDANKENVQADTRSKIASAAGQETENAFKPDLLRQSLEKGELDIQQAGLALQRTSEEISKIIAETSNIEADTDLKEAQRVLVFAQKALAEMQTEESYSRVGVNNAEVLLINQNRFAAEFDNQYRKEFGVEPSAGMASQVLGLIKTRAWAARNWIVSQPSMRDELRKLGKTAAANFARLSKDAKNRWQYLTSSPK